MALITGSANPDILNGTGLADTILGLAGDDALYGFDGDDRVEGDAGDNFLYGGIGNDTLIGGLNDDFVYGGSGDDILIGGSSEDFLYGGSGIDTASYATALAGLTLNLEFPSFSTGDAAGDSFLSVERFILSGLADTLYGSGLSENVQGGSGNDLMFGLGGGDFLFGDAGNDALDGGVEGDLLNGGAGFDTASYVSSGAAITLDLGAPSLTTGDAVGDIYVSIEGLTMTYASDTVRLDGGTIRQVDGEAGNDSLTGSAFADTLRGGFDDDSLSGGSGRDLLEGGDGNDSLSGGIGADTLVGGAGTDAVVYGTTVKLNLADAAKSTGDALGDTFNGIDQVSFTSDGSIYVGGATNIAVTLIGASMTCFAGAGAEDFSAVSGLMAVSYQNATARVELTGVGVLTGTRAALGDSLTKISSLTLSNFSDVLTMSAYDTTNPLSIQFPVPSTVLAGNGNDRLSLTNITAMTIEGGGGADAITGTIFDAQVSGGSGNDTVTLTSLSLGETGSASVLGDSGNDIISLFAFSSNTVDGGDGNDSITADSASLTSSTGLFDIDGGAGNDTLTVTALNSGELIPVQAMLQGGTGDDSVTLFISGFATIEGGSGNDLMTVSASNAQSFQVTGDLGNDTITAGGVVGFGTMSGGDGNDALTMSAYAGSMSGDDGNDTLIFNLIRISAGNALLSGGQGDDVLTVNSVVIDSFLPGQGAVLNGGGGNDHLTGVTDLFPNMSVDFQFNTGWGNDTVDNFQDGFDRIVFATTSVVGLNAFGNLTVTGDTTFTLATFGANSIRIDGLDVANFTEADVAFI